ncbi:UNC-like C-terminal-domain-containing protein [Fomitopsis serialis]|uniref:UNC-like C-terminal-domain-containing protein n=1 Tax=Fomitopsis serialis TaxID=139415 RepID=UPI002007337F|nr:UNC-like C-terminal-domain-containing protein [Neoantrodia serialis]KAH9923088.1 UNC-like C-terminal-domain-containing protein [Neoantrodia serialis]
MDARLLRSAHDDLGYRDYASYSAGARTIEGMTSKTYEMPDERGLFVRLFSRPAKTPHSASTALKRGTQPGHCWPMAGSSGFIGIQLAEPVLIKNVTVDHAPSSLTPAREGDTAPRSIVVWALIPMSSAVTTEPPKIQSINVPVPEGFRIVAIAQLEYDVFKPQHIQTFPVDAGMQGVKVDQVVFQVLSNWGSVDFTCLYRLRVHGESP